MKLFNSVQLQRIRTTERLNWTDRVSSLLHYNTFISYYENTKLPLAAEQPLTGGCSVQPSSVAQSCPTLWHPMETAACQASCPSPAPRACSNSCPLHLWCHPTISSSIVPFSSHLQSFPASESFPMSRFFASLWGIGVSALASVLPMNIQG